MVKIQKCKSCQNAIFFLNGQNSKRLKSSKRKNGKIVKMQKCDRVKTQKCENSQNLKLEKHFF